MFLVPCLSRFLCAGLPQQLFQPRGVTLPRAHSLLIPDKYFCLDLSPGRGKTEHVARDTGADEKEQML